MISDMRTDEGLPGSKNEFVDGEEDDIIDIKSRNEVKIERTSNVFGFFSGFFKSNKEEEEKEDASQNV